MFSSNIYYLSKFNDGETFLLVSRPSSYMFLDRNIVCVYVCVYAWTS